MKQGKDQLTQRQDSGIHPIRATKETNEKSENSPKNLWDSIKWTNIHIIQTPEKEQRWVNALFEKIKAENILNREETNIRSKKGQRLPRKGSKRPTLNTL